MPTLLAQTDLSSVAGNLPTAVSLLALSLLAGVMSLVVVWRRWAFLSEGIAHAGFGGAGTAWMLMALIPGLEHPGFVNGWVIVFCLLSGVGIGMLHQSDRIQSDTAIGAWLVGSLAWGFLGQQLYISAFHHAPAGFQALLFGQTELLTWDHAQLSISLAIICLAAVVYFRRPILLYCLEPTLAEVSGVKVARYHYLLIMLIALTIMLGVRLVGSVLITALLILPGATAMLLTQRLRSTVILAAGIGMAGAAFGIAINRFWPVLPQGPLIVLGLFLTFIAGALRQRMGK